MHMIKLPNTPTSTYALIGDIGIPIGTLFIAPSYSENIGEMEERLASYFKGIEIKSSIITQILVGELGYRRISESATHQHSLIQELNSEENENAGAKE